MNADIIPQEVQFFVRRHIRSVVELELLLLLHADPDAQWSAEQLGTELRVSPTWVEQKCEDLVRRDLLVASDEAPVRYRCRALQWDHTIRALADCYHQRRVSLIEFIYETPGDPVRIFADAFIIRPRSE